MLRVPPIARKAALRVPSLRISLTATTSIAATQVTQLDAQLCNVSTVSEATKERAQFRNASAISIVGLGPHLGGCGRVTPPIPNWGTQP